MKHILLLLLFAASLSAQSLLQLRADSENIQPINKTSFEQNLVSPAPAPVKSTPLAILYSVLLPGMGELYLDNYQAGKYFTMTDVALWVGYYGMSYYSKYQRDNFKQFAFVNGGVQPGVYSEDFYADLGNYMSQKEYNDEKSFQRQFAMMYNGSQNFWEWESQTERREYRKLWISSQQAKNNLRFVVGALVLNRAISAINAVRINAKLKKQAAAETSLLIGFSPNFAPEGGLTANLSLQF